MFTPFKPDTPGTGFTPYQPQGGLNNALNNYTQKQGFGLGGPGIPTGGFGPMSPSSSTFEERFAENLALGAKKTIIEPAQSLIRPAYGATLGTTAYTIDKMSQLGNEIGAFLSGTKVQPGFNFSEEIQKDPVLNAVLGGDASVKDPVDAAGKIAQTALNLSSAGEGKALIESSPTLWQLIKTSIKYGSGYGAAAGAQETVDEQGRPLSAKGRVGKIVIEGLKGAGEAAFLGPLGTKIIGATAKGVTVPEIPKKSEKIAQSNLEGLNKLESDNAPLRKIVQEAKRKNIDVKNITAHTDLLKDSVDNTGTIRTTQEGGAVQQLNEFIKPQETIISRILKNEGKSIPIADIETQLTEAINRSGLKGAAKIRALNNVKQEIEGYRLEADKNDNIPLSSVHDAKIDKYSNIDYSNPESSKVDKITARTLKGIVEKNTNSADVHALNKELASHFAVLKFLQKLDGKKVKGGKLGKYFAQTIGGMVGSHFGPLGTILGAEAGGAIKGALLSSEFGGKTGMQLKQSPTMEQALRSAESQEKSFGIRKTNQSTTISTTKTSTPEIIPPGETKEKGEIPTIPSTKIKVSIATDAIGGGKAKITLQGKSMGNINYSKVNNEMINIDEIFVDEKARSQGIGTQALKDFVGQTKKMKPSLKYITADITSQGSFHTFQKVLGKPEYIADAINEISLKDAIKMLPEKTIFDEDGHIDTSKALTFRFKIP